MNNANTTQPTSTQAVHFLFRDECEQGHVHRWFRQSGKVADYTVDGSKFQLNNLICLDCWYFARLLMTSNDKVNANL